MIELSFYFIIESPTLPDTSNGWLSVLALGIVCSAFCFIVQAVMLKYIDPVQLGLMYALEPIFASIIDFIFVDKRMTVQGYIGAALVLSGNGGYIRQSPNLRLLLSKAGALCYSNNVSKIKN